MKAWIKTVLKEKKGIGLWGIKEANAKGLCLI